jgi:phosphoribosylaminoimidazole-succinocarboxamide synthase
MANYPTVKEAGTVKCGVCHIGKPTDKKWNDYGTTISKALGKQKAKKQEIAGQPLPPGLREADRLDPPLFSPATKAVAGHDENIPVSRMAELVGRAVAAELEGLSRRVYERGRDIAAQRGIIVADTKFEFGRAAGGGPVLLIDEVLTPESWRGWPAARRSWSRGES